MSSQHGSPVRSNRLAAPVRLLRKAGLALTDALLPQTCLACDAWIPSAGPALCTACAEALQPILWRSCCHRCGRTIRPESMDARGCAGCRGDSTWNIAGLARVGPYRTPLAELILGLKVGGNLRVTGFLAGLMAEALRAQSWFDSIELLVPVPMHWKRRLQRRCNHALELTGALAAQIGRPVRRAVVRRRYSPSQMDLPSAARTALYRNVAGCFAPSGRPGVAGRTVCIVDNLSRSGATLHEVSKALRQAGAKRIFAVIVARAALPGDPQAEPETVPAAGLHAHLP